MIKIISSVLNTMTSFQEGGKNSPWLVNHINYTKWYNRYNCENSHLQFHFHTINEKSLWIKSCMGFVFVRWLNRNEGLWNVDNFCVLHHIFFNTILLHTLCLVTVSKRIFWEKKEKKIYLYIYFSIYLFIYLSIHPSISRYLTFNQQYLEPLRFDVKWKKEFCFSYFFFRLSCLELDLAVLKLQQLVKRGTETGNGLISVPLMIVG